MMKGFPPKLVLVAFDFSERSLDAWRYALALSKLVGCAVEAVYVRPYIMGPEVTMPLTLSAAERRALETRMASILGKGRVFHVDDGDVVLGILRAAKRRKAGLIMAGTEGMSGLRRLARSSVAEDLVRSSPVPVLTVRGPAVLPRRVLAPVNLKAYSFAGLDFAALVAKTFAASVTMLHVKEKQDHKTGGPLGRLNLGKAYGTKIELKTVPGKPVETILVEAEEHDLIVMVSHRHGLFHDAILGTTAEQVLRRSRAPVLTLPPLPVGRSRETSLA